MQLSSVLIPLIAAVAAVGAYLPASVELDQVPACPVSGPHFKEHTHFGFSSLSEFTS